MAVSPKPKPPLPFLKFVVLILFLTCGTAVCNAGLSAQDANPQTSPPKNNAVPPEPYVDAPLTQLIHSIPELKTLQPAQDQNQLAMILEHTSKNVDAQFKNFSDLAGKETVSEIRANPTTDPWGQPLTHPNQPNLFQDVYTYYIVREGTLVQTRIREYRRDRNGSDGSKPITSPILLTVPVLTFLSANFASSLLYFSTDQQRQERFRYLGEQHVGVRTAYVVAFAQVPGVATVTIPMRTTDGHNTNWFVQGIAWVDRSTFQVLQMRTELLAPHDLSPICGQNQLQTLIQFAAVQPKGMREALWLPTEADVLGTLDDCKNPVVQIARNVHHFSDYRLYDPDTGKIAAPKETIAASAHTLELAAHPYLEVPLPQLIKRVPQLKGISPAQNQQSLSMILQQAGKQVDSFFANLVDLIAREDITQQRLASGTLAGGMPLGTILQDQQRTHDRYLILRHPGNTGLRIEEFRMDAKGNHLDQSGLQNGFFITAEFALSSIHFASAFQWDSRFLYLGDQKIAGHYTYVLAFAQLPSEARAAVTMRGQDGTTLHLLSQGVAWIDKSSFHIRQLRTDLLAPQPEIGLAEQTTTIVYSEVRFPDAAPLWLPHTVDVDIKFTEPPTVGASDLSSRVTDEAFRNTHHYSDYLLYRVSTRVGTSQ